MKVFFFFFFVEWCQELTENKFCFRIYYYLWRQERQQSRHLKTLFIEYNEDRPLFPYVSFEKENSVSAKVLNILTFFNTFYFF